MAGPAGPRPLRGKSFYLDLPSGRSARELAEVIRRLGGVSGRGGSRGLPSLPGPPPPGAWGTEAAPASHLAPFLCLLSYFNGLPFFLVAPGVQFGVVKQPPGSPSRSPVGARPRLTAGEPLGEGGCPPPPAAFLPSLLPAASLLGLSGPLTVSLGSKVPLVTSCHENCLPLPSRWWHLVARPWERFPDCGN